jgi:hypothetical protein
MMSTLAVDAHATQVGGTLEGFGINDATTRGPDSIEVVVATVDGRSVWRIVASTPVGAVRGTCTRVSGQPEVPGSSEVHCERGAVVGESTVDLGDGDDRFSVAPSFPDRLRLLGRDGNDELTAGMASDALLDGGDGDNVVSGGEGDDRISFSQGTDPVRAADRRRQPRVWR